MKVIYLAANDAYVFTTDGQTIIQLQGESRLFGNYYSAKRAANRLGLTVDGDGTVHKAVPTDYELSRKLKGWDCISGGETA